jgi:RasGEF domain/RasGEF N-terminal motif
MGATRRRANSTAANQNTSTIASALQKHHRSNSEMSMQMYRGQRQKYKPDMNVPLSARSKSHQNLPLTSPSQTVFEMDPPPYETLEDETEDVADQGISMKAAKSGNEDSGHSFGELVDRLLLYPPSKADQRFASIFLALYRLFVSPIQLLDNIIDKWKAVGLDNVPALSTVQHRAHHLNILEKWIGNYPGDFAHPITKLTLQTFISDLGRISIFAVAANQLAANLECVKEDDDTDWAFCDKDRSASEINSRITANGKARLSAASGDVSTPISPISSVSPTMSSTQTLLSLVEQATRQAAYLVPIGRFPLSKLQWHLVMDQPEEAIARELTRMDWTMFCSIRPRDLVRHVTIHDSQKPRSQSLENVQRMIDHFNHIARWVSNFVILRDKPKHRSFMLEKMMKIARELRKMNNYNSLGALIAGINNSSVVRLSATRDLIDPAIGKDFLKLEILMSSQRSHAAYRLAWENTSAERIPYLPLHRRDLVAAAEGNKTFLDDLDARGGEIRNGETKGRRINWKKFEIIGDVVIEMQKARDVPYPTLVRSDEIKSLVVDMEIERDEDVGLSLVHFHGF